MRLLGNTDLLCLGWRIHSVAKVSGCDCFCRNNLEKMLSSGIKMWF